MYKLSNNGAITRVSGGVITGIPADPANTDYQEYLSWVAAGNAASPPDPLDSKEVARAALAFLERDTMMNRGLREFLLVAMQDLAQRQASIMGNGVTASMVLAGNSAWLRLVQIDTQATQLRAQL